MKFYSIGSSLIQGEKMITAKIAYKSYEIFKDPSLLIENNHFRVVKGRNLYDVLKYEDVFNFAISEGLKNALENNDVTGWSSYPIIVDGIDNPYFGFHVTGKGGEVTEFDKDGNVPISRGIKWNISKWDGSDIFNIEDTGITACTQKAIGIFKQFNIKSIKIKPL